jgi:radical SAM superfamily enzyme YgiQ (UPF0313 family)
MVERAVLLINAKTKGPFRPTGLEYLAEAVSNAGIAATILDLALEEDPRKAIETALGREEYRAVGISVFNTQWDTGRDKVEFFLPEIRTMIADLRKLTTAPIVLGGHGFSIQPEATLAYVGGDYGVAGCGIPAFLDLLCHLDEGTVARGTVLRGDAGEYLDTSFKRNTVDPARYSRSEEVFVSTKIGCLEQCFHCPTLGRKFRLRRPECVVEEVRNLAAQGVERISFMHDTFNVPLEHARAICEGISGLPIRWSAYIYPVPRFLTPELVDTMKASGMSRADVGARMTGSEAMLKAYGVGFGKDDIARATGLFTAKGIPTYWFLGFGAPGESRQTIDETFAFIDQVRPDSVGMFSRTRVYRWSPLGERCVREGLVRPGDELLEPFYYPFADELRDYIFEQAAKRPNCAVYY